MRSADDSRAGEELVELSFPPSRGQDLRGAIPNHLTRSLAEDIIARLALKIPNGPAPEAGAPAPDAAVPLPDDRMLDDLCDALMGPDPDTAAQMIERARVAGASPDSIYTNFIAAAARRLGDRWVADTASFFDVTVGLSRLHMIVRDIRPTFIGSEVGQTPGCSAYFAPVPSETHTLGIVLATDYFRRSGWRVDLAMSPTQQDMVAWATRRPYAVIGLSASCRRMTDILTETVGVLRKVCGSAQIVIGGKIVDLEPDIVALSGADHIVDDAGSAALSLKRFARPEAGPPE